MVQAKLGIIFKQAKGVGSRIGCFLIVGVASLNWSSRQEKKEAKKRIISLDLKVSLLVIPSLRSVIRGFLFLPSLSFSQS